MNSPLKRREFLVEKGKSFKWNPDRKSEVKLWERVREPPIHSHGCRVGKKSITRATSRRSTILLALFPLLDTVRGTDRRRPEAKRWWRESSCFEIESCTGIQVFPRTGMRGTTTTTTSSGQGSERRTVLLWGSYNIPVRAAAVQRASASASWMTIRRIRSAG